MATFEETRMGRTESVNLRDYRRKAFCGRLEGERDLVNEVLRVAVSVIHKEGFISKASQFCFRQLPLKEFEEIFGVYSMQFYLFRQGSSMRQMCREHSHNI
jgi:hypothetical protein